MTALEECREQLARIRARMRAYQEQLKEITDSGERGRIQTKLKTYRAAVRDIQVQINHLDPPEARKARREHRKKLDIGANWDFFESSGTCWSDLEGHSWKQVQSGDAVRLGATMEQLGQWMAEGSQRLTPQQRTYLDAYYNEGLSTEAIAQRHGITRSTVSRVIGRGLARMQQWVDAKQLILSCSDGKGGFDWERYLHQVPVLTDRQRQLTLLVLSRLPRTREELAEKLELDGSTVCRTLTLAERTLRKLRVSGQPIARPVLRDWSEADKWTLALDTGMPLYFYYRYCFRGQKVGGLTRYNYELARRQEAGETPEQVAQELGLPVRVVRTAYGQLRRSGVQIGHILPPEDDTMASRLPPEVYLALQRMVTGHADT